MSDAKDPAISLTKPDAIRAVSIEDLPELRRKLLKSRRNRMKLLPPFRRYPPFSWPPHSAGYNSFNMQHPYSCDCNYFLNPVNDVGVPTIEYIWENYDDIGENGDEVVKTDKQVVE